MLCEGERKEPDAGYLRSIIHLFLSLAEDLQRSFKGMGGGGRVLVMYSLIQFLSDAGFFKHYAFSFYDTSQS